MTERLEYDLWQLECAKRAVAESLAMERDELDADALREVQQAVSDERVPYVGSPDAPAAR